MSRTEIEWATDVWNPTRGCTPISPGCKNCYAMRQAIRQAKPGQAYAGLVKSTSHGPQWTGKIKRADSAVLAPLSWREPRRIFVDSMSDLFHERIPSSDLDIFFAVMALCPQHQFLVLTKRADRMRHYFAAGKDALMMRWGWNAQHICRTRDGSSAEHRGPKWPLPNVWLGVSVETQQYADERIRHLAKVPAAVRFVSYEPALGPVDFSEWIEDPCIASSPDQFVPDLRGPDIHWIIVGGESGPGARPFDVAWARAVLQQCKAAEIPVFVKQLGRFPHVGEGGAGPAYAFFGDGSDLHWRMDDDTVRPLAVYEIRDKKGGNWNEWPVDLRVREYPKRLNEVGAR